ncbi:MAG TPA: segregation/condensation protein A [Candidatus Aphodousia faecavium]|nr:segregation/condensation protein A [Candidatus Aphodousia faecavium]
MNPNALIDVAPGLIPDTTPSIEDVVAVARLKGEPLLHFPDDLYIPPDALKLFLESFEGPFDLLLYLIRKQRLDLNEISVAAVTDQYMEYVEQIRAQNMELASDYLVMAADLMMIKSRLLLPVPVSEDGEEEEDPTARILREVAEYEKIQVAAQLLNALPTMGDGFWRGFVAIDEEEQPEPEVLPQELARVWLAVVKNADLKINHTVSRQELSIHEFMSAIIRRVEKDRFVSFEELVQDHLTMQERVVSFLAILELSREGLISITQAAPYAPIYCSKKFLSLQPEKL